MTYQIALGCIVLTLMTGCTNEDAGSASLAMQAVTSENATPDDELTIIATNDTTFDISTAQLHLRDIELDLPDGTSCEALPTQSLQGASCDAGEDKIRIAGPIIVNLVTGQTTPSLSEVKIPAGIYDRIDFRIEDGDPEDGLVVAGSALDDRSFVVDAVFNYQTTPAKLRLSLKFNEDIRVEQPGGVMVEEGQDLISTWVTRDWLNGVDLIACLDDGDLILNNGQVILDDDSASGNCSNAEDTIKDNMKKTLQILGS